jgi:hypothetical protein
MRHLLKLAIPALALTMATTATEPTIAASTVQATNPNCMNAWATLMTTHPSVHAAFPHVEFKEAILRALGSTSATGGFERGMGGAYELLTFDTRFVEGGTAYVAHCGNGATCNSIGEKIIKAYPEVGTVYVYCTPTPPVVLDNPQAF